MRQILLHNWKIKLTCLVLAFAVWYVIQQNVNPGGDTRARTPFGERIKK
jgi:hypothetical protein